MGKSYLQQTLNMGNYFLEMERRHNLNNFFEYMLNTAESQELVDLVQEVQQGLDPEGNAKAFLGFNPDTKYGLSLMNDWLIKPFKPPVIPMPKLSGRMISCVYYDDFAGPTGPAKPEPDWKHPIPVSVKSDGPSKQKRAKLRAKRKK